MTTFTRYGTNTCEECGQSFEVGRLGQRFCSAKCRSTSFQKRNGGLSSKQRKCANCGVEFTTNLKRQRFCTVECGRVFYYNSRWMSNGGEPVKRISTASTGASSELLVAADLLLKGYHVFRSMSPACPCDLAILAGGRLLRVEVTTACYMPSGKLQTASKKNFENYDVVAYVVRSTREIIYKPTIEEVLGITDQQE